MQFQNGDSNSSKLPTISSANTFTISGDTASAFDNDANRSLRVLWWLAAG